MGGKHKESKKKNPVSRKDLRKQQRKDKKAKRNEYFKNKSKIFSLKKDSGETLINTPAKGIKNKNMGVKNIILQNSSKIKDGNVNISDKLNSNVQSKQSPVKLNVNFQDEQNKLHKQDMREKAKLDKGIAKARKKMFLEANKEDDREIKKLEKHLKLNKRKSKSVPKSFADEGLDYLLEVCDTDKLREAASVELNLQDSGSEFEDDLAFVLGKRKRKKCSKDVPIKKKKEVITEYLNESEQNNSDEEDISSNEELEKDNFSDEIDDEDSKLQCEEESEYSDDNITHEKHFNSGNKLNNDECSDSDISENHIYEGDEEDDNYSSGKNSSHSEQSNIEGGTIKLNKKNKGNDVWEDIYGRLRDKEGNIVKAQESSKYVPPHLRAQQTSLDSEKAEELDRLKRQLKGLINRLAESNMRSIVNQIDDLYMKNSRSDMNDCLMSLITEVLITRALTPERLVMEHAMLLAILHANVGMEIGAHFLQCFVQKFHSMYKEGPDVEEKELDNILLIISHMYNFKMFHAVLMYDLLEQLTSQFEEKEVELILLVLRSVGFSLRRDDPLALKDLVLRLQKRASEATHLRDNTRVRFMLDVLLAVKNNNMAKIPQYDPSHSEHLKKLLKSLVHKGKYVTELKVTLEDLLKAEERGRWWIVGSAWSGSLPTTPSSQAPSAQTSQFSQAVLELARKQRMNTDNRRNIFCILVTAEDYLDAFEKLLRLGLKGQQEQEIFHVMFHCLMREKKYNPYYAHLATHFCQTDRKHQMTMQYHLWDKLKELSNLSPNNITNLSKFLAHMFLEKALPLSVLKVMQFSEMDRSGVKLLRQVLLSLLLSDSEEDTLAVFSRVSRPEKLHMFRESLRLFLHHFVLKNVSELPLDQAQQLRQRVKLAETALTRVDSSNLKFL